MSRDNSSVENKNKDLDYDPLAKEERNLKTSKKKNRTAA